MTIKRPSNPGEIARLGRFSIASYSPDSHPELFKDRNAQLAYWINSYNATVIKGVIEHYPISSVTDIPPHSSCFFYQRQFINSTANVRFHEQEKTLYLSSIFKWYKKDFLSWLADQYPEREITLIDFLLLYLDEEIARLIENNRNGLKIIFIPYDWGLNDQKMSSKGLNELPADKTSS